MGVYEHVMMEQHEQCTGNNEQQSFTPHSWAVLVKWRKYQENAQSSQRREDGHMGRRGHSQSREQGQTQEGKNLPGESKGY